jgi:hypothetical protein
MRTLTAILATCALTVPAHADLAPDRVSLLVGTWHTFEPPEGSVDHWQQVNPGVFLTWESVGTTPIDVTFGGYLNSFGGFSITGAAALPLVTWDDTFGSGHLALFAGLATYPGDADHFAVRWGDVVPVGGIQMRHENLYMQVLPGKESLDPIFAFGLTFNLGG